MKQQTGKTEAFLLLDPHSLCRTSLRDAEDSGLGDIVGEWGVIDVMKREQGCFLALQFPAQL